MYIGISDLHIGHNKVLAQDIHPKLVSELYPQLTDECDGLFIAGDFFDKLITVDAIATSYAAMIMHEILQLAADHNFFVRVLRGTYLHDRNQLKLFETVAEYYPTVDMKYFDEIHLEIIHPDTNPLSVLYIPDNLPFKDTDEVMSYIKDKLKSSDLPKVDLIIGHGSFDHVLPEVAKSKIKILFNATEFTKLVNGYVIMGHIHNYSRHKKVVYCGSFDRLVHGEEETKGYLKITRYPEWSCELIPNTKSTKFVSVYTEGSIDDLDTVVQELSTLVSKKIDIESEGHLRLVVNSTELKVALIDRVISLFPKLFVSIKVAKGEIDEPVHIDTQLMMDSDHYDIPTEVTLVSDIFEFLNKYYPVMSLPKQEIQERISALRGI